MQPNTQPQGWPPGLPLQPSGPSSARLTQGPQLTKVAVLSILRVHCRLVQEAALAAAHVVDQSSPGPVEGPNCTQQHLLLQGSGKGPSEREGVRCQHNLARHGAGPVHWTRLVRAVGRLAGELLVAGFLPGTHDTVWVTDWGALD